MLQRNIQPRAEVVELVTAERRFRNVLARGLQRADVLPVFGIQVLPQERFTNHRQIKQRIVRHEQTIRKIRLDLRPELIKRRLPLHIRGTDAVDGDIRRVKLVAGVHETVQPRDLAVAFHVDDADRADRAGIAVRRFHVHGGKRIELVAQKKPRQPCSPLASRQGSKLIIDAIISYPRKKKRRFSGNLSLFSSFSGGKGAFFAQENMV